MVLVRSVVISGNIRGFTLLELMVVLAIMALLVALVPPLVSGASDRVALKGAARQLAAGLRFARSQAIARNRPAVLQLDLKARRYTLPERGRAYQLPEKIALKLFAAQSEFSNEHTGAIRFFPDGSSTGGRITVSLDDREYQVDVNWLTGQVTVYD